MTKCKIPVFCPLAGPVLRTVGRRAIALILAAAGILVVVPAVAAAQGRWVGTWATGPVAVEPPPPDVQAEEVLAPRPRTPVRVSNQTIRQVVRTSIGGARVRVTFTNLFGTEPLVRSAPPTSPRGPPTSPRGPPAAARRPAAPI